MSIDDIDLTELFPRTIFRFSPLEQLRRVGTEVEETRLEIEANNPDGILHESIDIVQGVFTLLYNQGYTNAQIIQAIKDTQNKNRARGYYE